MAGSSIKFHPFQTVIQPGFWNSLAKKKLEDLGLSEAPMPVLGSYTHSDAPKSGLSPRLCIEWDALETAEGDPAWNQFNLRGEVHLKNTVEAFKLTDKAEFIHSAGLRIWSSIESGGFWTSPGTLASFAVLMFADLKKFQFVYWVSYPAFNLPNQIQLSSTVLLSDELPAHLLQRVADLSTQFNKGKEDNLLSLLTIGPDESVTFQPFSAVQYLETEQNQQKRNFICLADPCCSGLNPGWPLRNLLIALAATKPSLLNSLGIVCLRVTRTEGIFTASHSLLIKIKYEGERLETMPTVVGWQKNEKGQLAPRSVNMRASMDPVKIAESSVDLNLKLMKWRLIPQLDLEKIKRSGFLLLGSGTLGCGVARGLLGWGARKITFLDNSKVSFSNPVRQSLFEFKDCLDGGKSKAEAAANKIRDIFPGVEVDSVNLSIPMPGHPVSVSLEKEVKAAHDKLVALIEDHDVIFLLMDSRESRWLPTVIAACYPDKIVINAALGFDTYLVMRHGVRPEVDGNPIPSHTLPGLIPGESLGCYFCNDVVAPGDSMSDRTLDMQCTVTRAGVSAVAAALAVELAVSCIQHPQGGGAPAGVGAGEPPEGVLGIIPHTIRGSLHSFNQYLPTGPSFSQCTACSQKVLQLYKTDGFELVRKVGEDPKYLEDLTGLTDLLNNSDIMDSVIGLSDDDTFSVTSE